MTDVVRNPFDRSGRCGVEGCRDLARHTHAGPLVVGEAVVLVVRRPDAPTPCWSNARGRVREIDAAGLLVEIDASYVAAVHTRMIDLQPGDAVRARDWVAPKAAEAKPRERKEAVRDAEEPMLFSDLEERS